jgi:uncharacterized protein YycO
VIRNSTGTDFSHTVLYIGNGQVVEAISEGVVERALADALHETTLAIALRRRFMTGATKDAVVRQARSFANQGLPYDLVGAAGAGLSHGRGQAACVASPFMCANLALAAANNARDANRDRKFFCSELVARCFELAGVPISNQHASYMTPRSVRVAPNLIYIGHLVGGP